MKMKFLNIFLAVATASVLSFLASCTKENLSGGAGETGKPDSTEKPYLPGEVIIKFDESLSDLLDESGLSKAPATRSGVSTVDELLEAIDGYQLERVFPEVKATETRSREAGLHLWYVVHFSEDEDVKDVVKKLSALGEVQSAAPVLTIRKAYSGKVIPFTSKAFATKTDGTKDPERKWQWSLENNGGTDYRINPAFVGDSRPEDYPHDKEASAKFMQGYDIGLKAAQEKAGKGDQSIIVAVLDEGVDISHPDLRNSIWTNEGEIYGSLDDNDENGYPGDLHGYDFLNDRGVITWDKVNDSGHGTHVSGVIAAQNDNGIGISSIAGGTPSEPGVRLMSCQIFSGNLSSDMVTLARAIKYATDNGAVILQCSFGYTSGDANPYEYGTGFRTEEEWEAGSPLEKATLDYFLENAGSENGPIKGGLAIYASGNEYAPSAGFPGAYEKCISVAAVAGDFTPSTFTNYGPGTNISAPGGDQDYYYDFLEADEDAQRGAVGCILSTVPDHISASGYGYMEGTSMACPHVSGVAALGLSYAAKIHKHFTAEEFKELLYESCQFLTDDPEDESNSTILRGNKFYYKWQVDASELIHARLLPLTSYRTKMGAGVINAANLISLIDNSGTDMVFPNLYIRTGSKLTADPSVYLDGSTFKVTISDPSVALVGKAGAEGDFAASASIDLSAGEVFTFSGLKSGYTTAEITSSEGTQSFIITVNTGSSSDWL